MMTTTMTMMMTVMMMMMLILVIIIIINIIIMIIIIINCDYNNIVDCELVGVQLQISNLKFLLLGTFLLMLIRVFQTYCKVLRTFSLRGSSP